MRAELGAGMLKRREVLALLAAIGAGPAMAFAAPGPLQTREPWGKFRVGPDYPAFVTAVRKLKANKNARSADSWLFWVGIHGSHCPHGKPYFLAWHRGYLFLFERKLRELSGSATLRLPYWDYFADPVIPIDFTKGNAGDNPLWEPRKGSSVGAALNYAAFAPGITAFERGAANAFEGKVEASPHNNIHNLIGGKMATMQSPQDVLFWLHHANVDRLWAAWLAAGQGRRMPAPGDAYWAGQHDYEAGLAVARNAVLTTEALGYRYADLALPKAPPAPPPAAPPPPPLPRVGAAPGRPPMVGAAPRGGNAASQAGGLSLGDESVTVTVPLARPAPPPPPMVMSAPGGARPPRVGAAPNRAPVDTGPTEVAVILDEVTLTEIGAEGGFFYKVYLNLPGVGNDESRLVGTIGPFQIAAAMNHGGHHGGTAKIELPATDLVRRLARGRNPAELGALSVSFVRVNADGAPGGTVIGIGGFRIEGLAGQ
ncbi:MAG: tyrosinase family protein [Pseudomonadota bacterium]